MSARRFWKNSNPSGSRAIRAVNRRVLGLLASDNWEAGLQELACEPPRKLYGPLLAGLLNPDPLLKWRSVSALGLTAAREADERLEDARVFMRRLMWSLNEESGNIGWGIAETFGEILACHAGLAREFSRVLCSYLVDRGEESCNYLEHDPLRQGVYWGLMRLAEVRPELVVPAAKELRQALDCPDPVAMGLAARTLGLCKGEALEAARPRLEELSGDERRIEIYVERKLVETSVGELARGALGKKG